MVTITKRLWRNWRISGAETCPFSPETLYDSANITSTITSPIFTLLNVNDEIRSRSITFRGIIRTKLFQILDNRDRLHSFGNGSATKSVWTFLARTCKTCLYSEQATFIRKCYYIIGGGIITSSSTCITGEIIGF